MTNLVDVVSLVGLVALGMKLVDLVKFITNRDVNAVVTQVAVWAAGIVVLWGASTANVFSGLVIIPPNVTVGSLNFGSVVLLGMSLLSIGSVARDYTKARDNTDTAVTPALLPAPRARRRGHVQHPPS